MLVAQFSPLSKNYMGVYMKKPKIGYLLTPITFGGSERVSLSFLKKVDREKYDIYPIIIIRPWEEENFFEKELQKLNYTYFKIPVSNGSKIDLMRYFRSYRKIKSVLKSQSVDLLHTHGYLADILGLFAAKSLSIPIVSTCHGFVLKSIKLRMYFKLDLLALKYFNSVIAVSSDIKRFLVANEIKTSLVEIMINAVDVTKDHDMKQPGSVHLDDTYRFKKDNLILGYIGRLSEEKGAKYLIEAIAALKGRYIPAKLLVIGEGPELDKLQQVAKESGVENDILFLGFQDDTLSFLKIMDIFVLPSLTEGTPLALLEAMSAKVPVVATRVGGVPDIIDDGITGVLVNPYSRVELAEAIFKLHSDDALKNLITTNASELIGKQYNMSSWIEKMQNYYSSILKRYSYE